MQDKKEKQANYRLQEVNLTSAEKDTAFPTRVHGMNTVFEVLVNEEFICHLCIDKIGTICIPHLCIPEENRTREKIMSLVPVFYEKVHPWCRENGCNIMVASCDGDDYKTTALFETFGFSMRNINMGIQEVLTDEGEV